MTAKSDIPVKTLARHFLQRRDQYEISYKIVSHEYRLRSGDLGKRQGGGEKQVDLASLDIAYQVGNTGLSKAALPIPKNY